MKSLSLPVLYYIINVLPPCALDFLCVIGLFVVDRKFQYYYKILTHSNAWLIIRSIFFTQVDNTHLVRHCPCPRSASSLPQRVLLSQATQHPQIKNPLFLTPSSTDRSCSKGMQSFHIPLSCPKPPRVFDWERCSTREVLQNPFLKHLVWFTVIVILISAYCSDFACEPIALTLEKICFVIHCLERWKPDENNTLNDGRVNDRDAYVYYVI